VAFSHSFDFCIFRTVDEETQEGNEIQHPSAADAFLPRSPSSASIVDEAVVTSAASVETSQTPRERVERSVSVTDASVSSSQMSLVESDPVESSTTADQGGRESLAPCIPSKSEGEAAASESVSIAECHTSDKWSSIGASSREPIATLGSITDSTSAHGCAQTESPGSPNAVSGITQESKHTRGRTHNENLG
jgi:hypothetical protein